MLGKTFKGLTDAMLTWQTERLLELAAARDDWVVHVRPELVVEIAFDGVQTSSRYPGGVALRFARVLRHRPDKRAAEADTLDAVLAVRAASSSGRGVDGDPRGEAGPPPEREAASVGPADGADDCGAVARTRRVAPRGRTSPPSRRHGC